MDNQRLGDVAGTINGRPLTQAFLEETACAAKASAFSFLSTALGGLYISAVTPPMVVLKNYAILNGQSFSRTNPLGRVIDEEIRGMEMDGIYYHTKRRLSEVYKEVTGKKPDVFSESDPSCRGSYFFPFVVNTLAGMAAPAAVVGGLFLVGAPGTALSLMVVGIVGGGGLMVAENFSRTWGTAYRYLPPPQAPTPPQALPASPASAP